MLFSLVCALVFFLPSQEVYGQQIKHLGAYDGIKSGAVRAFAEGYFGLYVDWNCTRLKQILWISILKTITNIQPSGIVDISSKKGTLFVLGSKGELLQYQYQKDSFKSILNLKYRNFLCFEQINDNTIIIGLKSGLLIYDLKSKKLSKVLYPNTSF